MSPPHGEELEAGYQAAAVAVLLLIRLLHSLEADAPDLMPA